MNPEQLRYPIGKWEKPEQYSAGQITQHIATIKDFPAKLYKETAALSNEILDTPYRPGGWTVRQVVHHCADSHMNAFIRFKLALTEELPIIKPYEEARWAEQPDYTLPVQVSLRLTEALHERWTTLLESLDEAQWQKGFIHPEHGHELKLFQVVSLYAWHCRHHFAHVVGVTGGR